MAIWNLAKKDSCVHCGAKISRGQVFCSYCGSPQEGGMVICGSCSTENPADSAWCKKCRAELRTAESPKLRQRTAELEEGKRWARNPGVFAVRFDDDDLKSKEIIVEPGTRAVLIENGKFAGAMPAGRYDVGSLKSKLASFDFSKKATIILIDEGDIALYIDAEQVRTKDSLLVDARLQITFRIDQPIAFVTKLMGGQNHYSIDQLRSFVTEKVKTVLVRIIRSYDYEELVLFTSEKLDELNREMKKALYDDLNDAGIKLVRVWLINVISEAMESLMEIRALRQIRKQAMIEQAKEHQVDVDEFELKKEIDSFTLEQLKADLDHKFKTDELKIEDRERRVDLLDRLRKAELLDKISRSKNEDEFDKFVTEQDMEKLLRQDDLVQLKERIEWSAEDRLNSRRFLQKKLEEMRSQELEIIRADFQRQLDERKEEDELRKLAAQIRAKKYLRESERLELELDVMQKIDLRKKEHLSELSIKLAAAKNDQDIALIGLEIKRAEADHENYVLELKQKREKKEDLDDLEILRGLKDIKLEEKSFAQKQQIELEKARHEMKMSEDAAARDFELQRMDKLSIMGPEALISLSTEERGKIIADLKRTETMSRMSETQIEAMVAQQSPEVAKALQEKYKAMDGAEKERFYNMLIESKDDQIGMQDRHKGDVMDMAKESGDRDVQMFNTAVTGSARSKDEIIESERRHTRDVMDMGDSALKSQTHGRSESASGSEGVERVCPDCGRIMKPGWRSCPYCGKKLGG